MAVIGLGSIGGVVAGCLGAADRHDVIAGVRQPIIQRLSDAMLRMPKDETVTELMKHFGSTLEVNTPDQFQNELREETALWEQGLKDVVRK